MGHNEYEILPPDACRYQLLGWAMAISTKRSSFNKATYVTYSVRQLTRLARICDLFYLHKFPKKQPVPEVGRTKNKSNPWQLAPLQIKNYKNLLPRRTLRHFRLCHFQIKNNNISHTCIVLMMIRASTQKSDAMVKRQQQQQSTQSDFCFEFQPSTFISFEAEQKFCVVVRSQSSKFQHEYQRFLQINILIQHTDAF